MSIVDLRGKLPVHPTARYGHRPLAEIVGVCWHYSGVEGDCSALDVARYHISPRPDAPNGWPGCGYTAIVRRDGVIEIAWPLDTLCWHANGGGGQIDDEGHLVGENNWRWIGVMLAGLSGFTEAQLAAALFFSDWCEDELNRPLLQAGHRHLRTNTACPGAGWDALYSALVWR